MDSEPIDRVVKRGVLRTNLPTIPDNLLVVDSFEKQFAPITSSVKTGALISKYSTLLKVLSSKIRVFNLGRLSTRDVNSLKEPCSNVSFVTSFGMSSSEPNSSFTTISTGVSGARVPRLNVTVVSSGPALMRYSYNGRLLYQIRMREPSSQPFPAESLSTMVCTTGEIEMIVFPATQVVWPPSIGVLFSISTPS